jgi:hypothetical protein
VLHHSTFEQLGCQLIVEHKLMADDTGISTSNPRTNKSKRGISMPQGDLKVVRERLRQAETIDSQRIKEQP